MPDNLARNSRQETFFPADSLDTAHVLVIGVGGVGRRVAEDLAYVKPASLWLCDPDTIEDVNTGPQRWFQDSIGLLKVLELADSLPDGRVDRVFAGRFSPNFYTIFRKELPSDGRVFVFCCVDNIESRREIRDILGRDPVVLIDGRVGGETFRIVTAVCNGQAPSTYHKTLPKVALDAPCAERMGTHVAATCAATMIGQMSRFLRKWPVPRDIVANLKTYEWEVTE